MGVAVGYAAPLTFSKLIQCVSCGQPSFKKAPDDVYKHHNNYVLVFASNEG